jgi:hypothetical protein
MRDLLRFEIDSLNRQIAVVLDPTRFDTLDPLLGMELGETYRWPLSGIA